MMITETCGGSDTLARYVLVLIRAWDNLNGTTVCFHRAFDMTRDASEGGFDS